MICVGRRSARMFVSVPTEIWPSLKWRYNSNMHSTHSFITFIPLMWPLKIFLLCITKFYTKLGADSLLKYSTWKQQTQTCVTVTAAWHQLRSLTTSKNNMYSLWSKVIWCSSPSPSNDGIQETGLVNSFNKLKNYVWEWINLIVYNDEKDQYLWWVGKVIMNISF